MENVAAEPFWQNARFDLNASLADRQYFGLKIGIKILSDIFNPRTNRPYREAEWLTRIRSAHTEQSARENAKRAKEITDLVRKVPPLIISQATPRQFTPKLNETVALMRKRNGTYRYAKRNPYIGSRKSPQTHTCNDY